MLEVRTITDDEVTSWSIGASTGFHEQGGAEDAEVRRSGLVLDRTWAAFDGGRAVATLRTFPTRLSVPGGADVTASAVTAVTTSGTHRRRGLASTMMSKEMAASKDRGEQSAILIAAEYPIYGRFGYGPATWQHTWTVEGGAPTTGPAPSGTVEFIDDEASRAQAPVLAEAGRQRRPGDITWSDRMWDMQYGILRPPSWPEPKKSFSVLARDAQGEPIGLVRYRYDDNWQNWQAKGTVVVTLMIADREDAFALLWRFLLGLDLTSVITIENRPVDEPLRWLLADGRRAQVVNWNDFLWVRPLDTPAFLSARRYPVNGRVVLEVSDPLGLAGGRFALDAGPDGASCKATSETADLTLSVATLASVSLGGSRLQPLAKAGRIDEHTAGALERADLMFSHTVAPWCSTVF